MALDSTQKRMSAMNLGCPWRGPLVDATESSFSAGNRAAAVLMYSGVVASVAAVGRLLCGAITVGPRLTGNLATEGWLTGTLTTRGRLSGTTTIDCDCEGCE